MTVLNNPTLVLNKGWMAIRVERLEKALIKSFKGLARFIDDSDSSTYSWEEWFDLFSVSPDYAESNPEYKYITLSQNRKVRAPEVVVLTHYNRVPKVTVKLTRRNLFIRDGFRCQYTHKKLKMSEGTIDHVIPRDHGGTTCWENVVLCSVEANRRKANKTLAESGFKLHKLPKRPAWHPVYTYFTSDHPKSWDKYVSPSEQWSEQGYWDTELID